MFALSNVNKTRCFKCICKEVRLGRRWGHRPECPINQSVVIQITMIIVNMGSDLFFFGLLPSQWLNSREYTGRLWVQIHTKGSKPDNFLQHDGWEVQITQPKRKINITTTIKKAKQIILQKKKISNPNRITKNWNTWEKKKEISRNQNEMLNKETQ